MLYSRPNKALKPPSTPEKPMKTRLRRAAVTMIMAIPCTAQLVVIRGRKIPECSKLGSVVKY